MKQAQNRFFYGSLLYFTMLIIIAASAFSVAVLLYERYDPGVLTLNVESLRQAQLGEVEAFLILANRFSQNHEYSDSYDCVNYTNDIGFIAGQLGFNIEKVVGCRPENLSQCHEWVRLKVDYEPQQGSFIDYSRTYINQRVVG